MNFPLHPSGILRKVHKVMAGAPESPPKQNFNSTLHFMGRSYHARASMDHPEAGGVAWQIQIAHFSVPVPANNLHPFPPPPSIDRTNSVTYDQRITLPLEFSTHFPRHYSQK
jgi:hypothetical protein